MEEFDHTVGVPPEGSGIVCDPDYHFGDYKVAIDYEGDVLGHDLYPDIGDYYDPTTDLVPIAGPFREHTPIEVYLD